LLYHEKYDRRHNPEKIVGNRFSNRGGGGAGNKRHSFSYESSKDVYRYFMKYNCYNNSAVHEIFYGCWSDDDEGEKKAIKLKLKWQKLSI